MLVQHIQDVVVGSMVQLPNFWLLAMLVCQVPSEIFVKSRQHRVFDSFDSNYSRVTIVERRCGHKIADDFIPFGALKVDGLQCVAGRVRRLTRMPAPTWLCETEILASAVVRYPFWALLLW